MKRPTVTGRRSWVAAFVTFVSIVSFVAFASFVQAVGLVHAKPVEATRIISLVPALTEMVFAIGGGDRVIAVSSYDDYPPQVRNLPKVGALIDPDVERIIALQARPGPALRQPSRPDDAALTRLDPVFRISPWWARGSDVHHPGAGTAHRSFAASRCGRTGD